MCEKGSDRKEEEKVDIPPRWMIVLEFAKLVHEELMPLEPDREVALEIIRMITALAIH